MGNSALNTDGPVTGCTRWAIADGYIPGWSHGLEPEMASHEALCFLNTNRADAHVRLHVYFSDRAPVGPYLVTVPAQRTRHVRLNELTDPEPIPAGTGYAVVVDSDLPVVVQQTRLDSRQSENAVFSTVAYAAGN